MKIKNSEINNERGSEIGPYTYVGIEMKCFTLAHTRANANRIQFNKKVLEHCKNKMK